MGDKGPATSRESAPVARKATAIGHLQEAVPRLEQLLHNGILTTHAELLAQALLAHPGQFVTLDPYEIVMLRGDYIHPLIEKALKIVDGRNVLFAKRVLSKLTGLHLNRPFRSPVGLWDHEDVTAEDEQNLDRLLGSSWLRPVPWEPEEDGSPGASPVSDSGGNPFGRTELHAACQQEKLDIVKKLIGDHSLVNARTKEGWTALMFAARNPQIVRLLLEAGGDPNVRNHIGRTALMWAVLTDSFESVQALVAAGADLSIKDDDGRTALDLARTKKHLKPIAEFLSKHRAE